MSSSNPKTNRTSGMASLELLLVIASLVIAAFKFLQLAQWVIQHFFAEGNQLTGIPFF